MAKNWWDRTKTPEPEEESVVPKELIETRAKVDEMGSKLEQMLSGLNAITSSLSEEKAEKERARVAREQAAAKKNTEDSRLSPEDLAAQLFSDPEGTVKNLTDPLAQELMEMRAAQTRRDVFENTEKYEYYTGDFKAEVDQVLAAQTLAFRNNPASVENVYFNVLGRKQKEIAEGKIKSRFAGSTGSTTQSGKGSGTGDKFTIDVDDQIRRAAKLVGMKPEEYAALVAEDAQEGNIAYV
jgi:hypothetical protein